MRGVWKRSQGSAIEAPPGEKGRKQTGQSYHHRATSLLYHKHKRKSSVGLGMSEVGGEADEKSTIMPVLRL